MLPLRRLVEADQVSQQGALAAPAAAHDDEDIALVDGEGHVAHEHEAAVCHGEIAHGDAGRRSVSGGGLVGHQIPRT